MDKPLTLLADLRRRTNLVHGLSKDDAALDLARTILRLLPSLDSLAEQAGYSSSGVVHGQTKAIEAFVSTACSLARTLTMPIQ